MLAVIVTSHAILAGPSRPRSPCGVIKGGTMVGTFGDCSFEELPFDPKWVDVPIESQRGVKN